MQEPTNQAAWLHKAGTPLEVGDASMPAAGMGEIVVRNRAVAINPLDCHMQDSGVFVQQWPTIFGCDISGVIHDIGPDVTRFKKGDRVIGHTINLVTGRPSDGAYALYTIVPVGKAAILPDNIPFTDGVVVPFAFEAAICALSVKEPGPCMPGVTTPALGLPFPTLELPFKSLNKTLVVYGASSSVGSMTTQIATAAGVNVIGVAGKHNHQFVKECGAAQVFDHKADTVVEDIIEAILASKTDFVGIFDAISTPETYHRDLTILKRLNGGHLACVHPPPAEDVPSNVKTGMIFAVNEVANPLWKNYVTPALDSGDLKCLPRPKVVGKGLEYINKALEMSKTGVSATKLIVEL